MPAGVKLKRGKFRVVEPDGSLIRNKKGTPVDGGGHDTEGAARKQANAINTPKRKRRKR